MDDNKVTRLPQKAPDVSEELAVLRSKLRLILESVYFGSVRKPLSLEATVGLGAFLNEIDQGLAGIQKKLGYSD